ncbi:MAG: hypothetical protein HN352_08995 [Bacteroidetes bacterium]|jgi:hypothetical protein|nr:hypothetical protein [Bacteroidota bacterium]MBT3747541.1 hypothetical protein [Bacteroidota bacterium]MBT4401925.1 hypothetical protein [Bacteroidota bacterium]MBT4410124.1 hypothetical protein [Bacteroidota bacterium]MBT7466418.1 hypothetical protein [Bacteroidota bacterium]
MRLVLISCIAALITMSCTTEYESLLKVGEISGSMTKTDISPVYERSIGGNDEVSYDLDIDDDGNIDIRFTGSSGMPASGNESHSWDISCVNTAFEFACEEITHTYRNCTREEEGVTHDIFYTDKYQYTCTYTDVASDLTKTIWSPTAFSSGDVITSDGKWSTEPTILTDYRYYHNYLGNPGDTDYATYYEAFGNWPSLQNKYILIRKNLTGSYRYGWIKISFMGTDSIKITEFAL